eukprot:CAMPEP_0176036224 /NCGR_PEP_ID=MMETSP0120_2-20121206/17939_1 /TAXON_ID=160619 /ORGANISM="Kryptoperidinium foliaceum, Strain CCMP 1326" /LENGTH=733 /DNA_ID=CAMNT_0017369611 /DNA_START=53 /DNA_END=2254 /DNA_ORIENTATION=+
MAPLGLRSALALCGLAAAAGKTISRAEVDTSSSANPIRRVVSMLQNMQQKVTAEGKREKELFEKFQCYCTTGASDLSASISAAEAKITQDTSSLEQATAQKAQLEQDLAEHQKDRSDAKEALAKARALREKEAKAYAKESSEYKTNVAALGKAIMALDKGMTGFLQTSTGALLRKLTINMDMSNADRDMLSAFLSTGASQKYAPASGQIVGILKEMKDTMEKDLAEMTSTEEAAVKDFEELSAAKTKEVEAHGAAIESKTERHGQVGLEIVALQEDLDDTSKALSGDKEFLQDLDKNCATKKQEWEERSKTRAEELVALADTIKLLNDDEALDLFKKTLPSAALLQTEGSFRLIRQHAVNALKAARGNAAGRGDPRLDMVMLALQGRSKNFDKVLKMIDDMVSLLGKEQTDDDAKKVYCEGALDKTEDEKKALERQIEDHEKSMADAKEGIATLTEELASLAAGIKSLDKAVAEATETRKDENAEYKDTMAANKAAKELLGVAKNRLAKFYTPKIYKAPPKRELSAEDRIFVNNGGTPPPTEAPTGIAGTDISPVLAQIAARTQRRDAGLVAPPPPPETWDAYAKKGQEHNGVVAMLDMLVADLDKQMTEADVEEKDSQKEYESFMEDSKRKRATDAQLIAEKEGYKAELETELQKTSQDHKVAMQQAMGRAEQLRDLHLECDWLMSNFDARKEARTGEIESLKNAKAVLSGADFALVERTARRTQLRGSAAK